MRKMVTEDLDIIESIMAFEEGELSEEETINMFQALVDSGMIYQLQGSYHRMANVLMETGLIHSK